jgi:hypothetical protein
MNLNNNVIAIDPGETSGWSWFRNSSLVACAKHRGIPRLPEGAGFKGEGKIVIEKPMVYPGAPVDVNDLITLAIKVGEWKEYLWARFGVEPELVTAPTWKGSVPKEIHHQRLLKVLTEEERAIMPKTKSGKYDHNMLDAVGLGLWKLGRGVR